MLNAKKILGVLKAIEEGAFRLGSAEYCYAGGAEIRVWNRGRYDLWDHTHVRLPRAYEDLLAQTGAFGAVTTVGEVKQRYETDLPGNSASHIRVVDIGALKLVREAVEKQAAGAVSAEEIINYVSGRRGEKQKL